MPTVQQTDLPMTGTSGVLVDGEAETPVRQWTLSSPPNRDLSALQLRLEAAAELRSDIGFASLELRNSGGQVLRVDGTVFGPLASDPGIFVYRVAPLEQPLLSAA